MGGSSHCTALLLNTFQRREAGSLRKVNAYISPFKHMGVHAHGLILSCLSLFSLSLCGVCVCGCVCVCPDTVICISVCFGWISLVFVFYSLCDASKLVDFYLTLLANMWLVLFVPPL